MESNQEYNARMLAAALSGIILAEIKYSDFSLHEKLYLAAEMIRHHSEHPIATSDSIIKEIQELINNMKDETKLGIREGME